MQYAVLAPTEHHNDTLFGRSVPEVAGTFAEANHVVLMQDGVSMANVQMFTSMNDMNCTEHYKVWGFKMVKPMVVHPLQDTNDFYLAMDNMVQKYRSLFNGLEWCQHPFMVFCNLAIIVN